MRRSFPPTDFAGLPAEEGNQSTLGYLEFLLVRIAKRFWATKPLFEFCVAGALYRHTLQKAPFYDTLPLPLVYWRVVD